MESVICKIIVRVVRWLLFLTFLATTWLHLGLPEHRGTRLVAVSGHFFVILGGFSREVSHAEYQELSKLKTISWALFWGSAVACSAWGLSLAWHYNIKPHLQERGR